MSNFLNSERVAIDITNNKISYIEIEEGKVKMPVRALEMNNFSEQEKIIINAAISVIKEKSKEPKGMF